MVAITLPFRKRFILVPFSQVPAEIVSEVATSLPTCFQNAAPFSAKFSASVLHIFLRRLEMERRLTVGCIMLQMRIFCCMIRMKLYSNAEKYNQAYRYNTDQVVI